MAAPDILKWIAEQGYRVIDVGEEYVTGDLGMAGLLPTSKWATNPRHYMDLRNWQPLTSTRECNEEDILGIRSIAIHKITEPMDVMLSGLLDAEQAYVDSLADGQLVFAGRNLDVYHVILNQLRHAIEASEERVRRATEEAACVKQD
jgi:hypothetical protein